MEVVYFSTNSNNTKRFVENLGIENSRIPVKGEYQGTPQVFVLVTPTYGGGDPAKAVPPQVIRFLNNKENRKRLIGVVSTGNRNFGTSFAIAGQVIAAKCKVPHIASVELFGTPEDVQEVRDAVIETFKSRGKDGNE